MGAEADGLLAGALARTLAAGTARLTLTRHYDLTASVPVLRRQGGIVNSAVRRALGGTLSVRVDRGAIDFASARCALAGERRSRIVAGDSEWTGRPGAHVETGAEHAARAAQPLWLLDLCRGIVDAEAPSRTPTTPAASASAATPPTPTSRACPRRSRTRSRCRTRSPTSRS